MRLSRVFRNSDYLGLFCALNLLVAISAAGIFKTIGDFFKNPVGAVEKVAEEMPAASKVIPEVAAVDAAASMLSKTEEPKKEERPPEKKRKRKRKRDEDEEGNEDDGDGDGDDDIDGDGDGDGDGDSDGDGGDGGATEAHVAVYHEKQRIENPHHKKGRHHENVPQNRTTRTRNYQDEDKEPENFEDGDYEGDDYGDSENEDSGDDDGYVDDPNGNQRRHSQSRPPTHREASRHNKHYRHGRRGR